MSRRELLAGVGSGLAFASRSGLAAEMERRPRIAALVTEYRENSHGDVIVTKFLEGCRVLDFEFRPQVEVASLYLDQVPPNDLGRGIAARHRVPVYETVEGALTLGSGRLAVDGVLLIGEHGKYPYDELGRHMYPRRRLFSDAAEVMRRSRRAVPLFNDKHLSYNWPDARWMYDTARELKIPFMAGSSLPVTWRKPDVDLPRGTPLTEALVVAYGPVEAYGFHALETLQCMVERRKGGETGVASVEYALGDAVWKAGERGAWSRDLLHAALSRSESAENRTATLDQVKARAREPEAFLIEYRDGLRAAVLMLHGLGSEFLFAAQPRGTTGPVSTLFWLQDGKPFGHFARLSAAIQKMLLTGRPTYPVERTLLTTGILDAAMSSRFEKGTRRATPELEIRYRPA